MTHQLQLGGMGAMWQRIALPYAGGVSDQPARLIDALAFVCEQRNGLLWAPQMRRQRRRQRKGEDG